MNIKDVHKWEQAIVILLNFDGWNLEWCAGGNKIYDAIGKTQKGFDCVIEMKFRKKYYDTTFWNNKKVKKPCYLLPENIASIINRNDE